MPDFTKWMNWSDTDNLENWLDDANRAGGVAFMIGHRGVSITLIRGATTLAAQTVLLVPGRESASTPEPSGGGGVAAKDQHYAIGTRGHPTLPDLNIARGDRFKYQGQFFEVMFVDKTMIGKTQAVCESML